jgi:hypothetical protein
LASRSAAFTTSASSSSPRHLRQRRIGLGLARLAGVSGRVGQQRHAARDEVAEALLHLRDRGVGVFDHVVQVADDLRRPAVGLEQGDDGVEVVDVGVRAVLLVAVHLDGVGARGGGCSGIVAGVMRLLKLLWRIHSALGFCLCRPSGFTSFTKENTYR